MQNFVLLVFIENIVTIQASKPRSVNVALETVLEFDNKDDVAFIDTVQNFLNKLKTTLTRNRAANDEVSKLSETDNYEANKHLETDNNGSTKQFHFTDFLAETVNVLKSYEDEDLTKFLNTLDTEIKMWQTRKEFQKLTDNLGFRRLIDRNLQNIKNYPVRELRRKLDALSDSIHFGARDGNNGFVANFLNYFYNKESEANLSHFLNSLKLYRSRIRRRNMTDLKKIIRNGILTIVDPLLKLNSNAISNIYMIFNKYITNSSEQHEDKSIKHGQKHKYKHKISRENNNFRIVLNDNEILDYIEDHKKVIDKHLTTTGFVVKSNNKPKRSKTTGTTYKYIHTTRSQKNRNVKSRQSNLEKVINNPENIVKHIANIIKHVGTRDHAKDRKPILINLANKDDSGLKSVEQYLSSTSKRQKRYKKSTRPKKTTKRSNFKLKTSKKSRKAFRTTTLSAEGLSIEHFGSLFGREFHRKSNVNDTFIQTVSNSSSSATPSDATTTVTSEGFTIEMRRKNNLSRDNEENKVKNYDETKTISESIEDTTKDTEIVVNNRDVLTESIKIKGNIIIEKPTETSNHSEIEITTSTPIKESTTHRNFNVSVVTKYFNIKPMKPTIILRDQGMERFNEMGLSTPKASTVIKTTGISAQTTSFNISNSEKEEINIKTTEDGLENEIEDIMDKHNTTQIPVDFENFVKEVQTNSNENKKVKEQMQADLEKLLAPPSTKSSVTELFTDPFNDIDDGADIL